MFRLWFLTFAGQPRDHHIYEHAHESPRAMTIPLAILAVMAIIAGWKMPGTDLSLPSLLEQARPVGFDIDVPPGSWWSSVTMPAEHLSHAPEVHDVVSLLAFFTALAGFLVAVAYYGLRFLNPETARRAFAPIYFWLWYKWFFDELYHVLFVMPAMVISRAAAAFDRHVIDGFIDGAARFVRRLSVADDLFDRIFVDGLVNLTADVIYGLGVRLRTAQTGQVRQYVMAIAVGTVGLYILVSLFLGWGM
jgi:NADH-quinone oxidoreductase subunit L